MAHPLLELALVYLKIGATSFGGPAAHIALMEDEVVTRRAWITRAEFVDMLGATNLIPGPNSTEMALHVGLIRAGWRGLLVAGLATIAPAFLAVLGLSWLYVHHGSRPEVGHVLGGIKPVMLAIVAQALWRLARPALGRSKLCMAVAAVAAGLAWFYEGNDLAIVLGSGLCLVVLQGVRHLRSASSMALLATAPGLAVAVGKHALPTPGALLLVFMKIGGTMFGSGYVLLSYLRTDLVIQRGWITESQLLDAVAIGQVTPGPLFTSATFIGYLLAGFPGALLATMGIFLPAFVLVALSGPLLPRLRNSRLTSAFLDGVSAASVALMAVVTVDLLHSESADPFRLLLFLGAVVILVRTRINSAWLILAGALFGLAREWV